jgi:hypothetical protein
MNQDKDDRRREVWLAALVLALSLFEYRMSIRFHLDAAIQRAMVDAAWGVCSGEPHWAEYQSRLLGPWLVRGLSATGLFGGGMNGFGRAFLALLLVLTVVKNWVVYRAARRLGDDVSLAVGRTVGAMLFFVLLQDPKWIFLWDHLDVIVFTLFLLGAKTQRGLAYFVGLGLIAILNRQSGLFIALWLCIDGLVLWKGHGRPQWLHAPRRLIVGVGLLMLGTLAIHFEEKWLLVRELAASSNPEFFAERPVHLIRNLKSIYQNLVQPGWTLGFLPGLAVLGSLLGLPIAARGRSDFARKQSILLVGMIASVMLFGLINETRVYSMLIPFAALLPFRSSAFEVQATTESGTSEGA